MDNHDLAFMGRVVTYCHKRLVYGDSLSSVVG